MTISISYEELKPTTTSGYSIKLSYVYSSFEKEEIDELKEKLADEIGTGLVLTSEVEE